MYKIPAITQEEAFSLFMWGLEPKIWEQIGFHAKGDLGRAMLMVEKVDVWREKGKGDKSGEKHKNLGEMG